MAIRDKSIEYAREKARKIFARRGDHTEIHVSETYIAALLALAYQAGARAEDELNRLARSYATEIRESAR